MDQRDLLFLVMILIAVATIVVLIVRLIPRSRRRDDRGPWWEGPWDDDDRNSGRR